VNDRPRRSRHRSAWRTVRHDPVKRHESYPYRRLRADVVLGAIVIIGVLLDRLRLERR
jgi:hypothetical protein